MPKFFKQKFKTPMGEITSLVLDQQEFDEFIDTLDDVFLTSGDRTSKDYLKELKDAKYLPMMSRGSKTKHVFEKYEITTDLLSAVVRGAGKQVFRRYANSYPDFPNKAKDVIERGDFGPIGEVNEDVSNN